VKISIIIPVGNMAEWKVCETFIRSSLAAYAGPIEAEVLPCFDLEHKGAFLARNEGLSRATGAWVAWVDCDDLVEASWFPEIARAIEAHPDCDVIQFDATEVKDGKTRPLPYGKAGAVSGEAFAHGLLRNDGMPAWLWTRVFRRELFAGRSFCGRVKQDYRMFLEILPRIKRVWSVGKPLYRYVRYGHGLSNYVQQMDYKAAGEEFLRLIKALPADWHSDAELGLALTMADVARHSRKDNGARHWVRKHLLRALVDPRLCVRLKAKCLLAAMGC